VQAEAQVEFERAVALAAENLVVDAAAAFREVASRWPDSELADDALYNVGACYLALNQFARAADTFREVIERYPNATISASSHETGRTAAKAWLGLASASLGLGRPADATAAVAKLASYPDSKVTPAPGVERSFLDIGQSLLNSALAQDAADQVSPSDVVS
jgi:tetratricopeptide (TPR) repeat protein